jgi:NAD(P)-dependent dehydrogenase (short-subunit alcohol dehydrogenase family)
MGRLEGKVAIVTGAGSGIGRASALRFADEGACVAVVDVDAATVTATAADIAARGGEAISVTADVTSAAAVDHAVGAAVERFGRLDVLFACAGGTQPGDAPVTEVDLAVWAPTIDVNLLGTVLSVRSAIPAMAATGGGSIITITSIGALLGSLPMHLYSAAKGGVISFTRSVAGHYWRDGIRANTIAPGTILTERVAALVAERTAPDGSNPAATAMGFDDHPFAVGSPEELAGIVVFLASDESRLVTGTVLHAEGGLTAY